MFPSFKPMTAKSCYRERKLVVRASLPPDGPHVLTLTLCPERTKVAEVRHVPGSDTTDVLLSLNRKNVCRTSANVVMITRALNAVLHGLISVRSDTTSDHGWTVVLWYVHVVGARNPVVYDHDRWLEITAAVCNSDLLLVPSLVSAARNSADPCVAVEDVQPASQASSVSRHDRSTQTESGGDDGDLLRRLTAELDRERASHSATQQELHELELQLLLRDDVDVVRPCPRRPQEEHKYVAVPEPEPVWFT